MHLSVTFKILGILLMLFSSALLTPLLVALLLGDDTISTFLAAFGITFCSGLALWLPVRNSQHELRIRPPLAKPRDDLRAHGLTGCPSRLRVAGWGHESHRFRRPSEDSDGVLG